MAAETTESDPFRMASERSAPRGPGTRLAAWSMGTAVLALALAASSPVWVPMLRAGAGPDPALAAAEQAAEAARGAQARAEQAAGAAREAARSAPLAARIETLETAVQKLAAASAGAPGAADIRRLALAGAVAQLRPAVARPTPFAVELAVVQGLAQGQERYATALRQLAPHANVGIPTQRQLRVRFAAAADAALMAESGAEGVPLASEFLTWIAATAPFGSGRVVHDLMMPETAAALQQARDRLREDDLDGAIAAAGRLRGAAAVAMEPWIAAARARAAAIAAMDRLVEAALADLPGRAP